MTGVRKPAVGVVITCHNYGRFVADAIASALEQSHEPATVVVVDDGSTDETAQVCAVFGDRIEYVRQQRGGPNVARNAGLALVRHMDYVLFLDADDKLAPDYVEACLGALASDPGASYAYTQWQKFGDRIGVSEFPAWSLRQMLKENFVNVSALVRTDVLRDVQFDTRLTRGSMDWDLYLTLASRGHRGLLVDRPLLHYRQHDSSIRAQLRQNPYSRSLTAIRLAWKHRRLYGWRRLTAQTVTHAQRIAEGILLRAWRSARRKVRGVPRRIRRAKAALGSGRARGR